MRAEVARKWRMPCGRYKGELLGLVPLDYLEWAAGNWNDKVFREAVKAVYKYRKSLVKTELVKITNIPQTLKPMPKDLTAVECARGELVELIKSTPDNLF